MSYQWRPKSKAPKPTPGLPARDHWLRPLSLISLYAGVTVLLVPIIFQVLILVFNPKAAAATPPRPPEVVISIPSVPSPTPRPTATPRLSPTPEPIPDVAIVAGHWTRVPPGDTSIVPDPGSVCRDGTREVDVNYAVATTALRALAARGFNVTLFEEWDSRLKRPDRGEKPDFRARAFFSIHSDACVEGPDYANATGYKLAHAQPSENESEDERLLRCVRRSYGALVEPMGLRWNQFTITNDMTAYHGFREIDPKTPAAIIELGFLGNDRKILTGHQEELGQSIAEGITSFLQGAECVIPQ